MGWYSGPSGSSSLAREAKKKGMPSPMKLANTAGVLGLLL
jgi:hypothetical protein